MTKRNLGGKGLVCAVMLAIALPACAVAPGDGSAAGWVSTLYSRVLEWCGLDERGGPDAVSAGSTMEGGEVATTDGDPSGDSGIQDPRTERGVAGDPNG